MYWVCRSQINPRGGADDTRVLMVENYFQSQPPSWTWCNSFNGLVPKKKEKASQWNYRKQESPCQQCISLYMSTNCGRCQPHSTSNERTHHRADHGKGKTGGSVETKSVQVTYLLLLRYIFRIAIYEKWKTPLGFAEAQTMSTYYQPSILTALWVSVEY